MSVIFYFHHDKIDLAENVLKTTYFEVVQINKLMLSKTKLIWTEGILKLRITRGLFTTHLHFHQKLQSTNQFKKKKLNLGKKKYILDSNLHA